MRRHVLPYAAADPGRAVTGRHGRTVAPITVPTYVVNTAGQSAPVTLLYSPTDQFAVSLVYVEETHPDTGGPVTWTLARDLLRDGLNIAGGMGDGDVIVWADAGRAYVRLSSPDGTEVHSIDAHTVRRFLAATYLLVPSGDERIDVDAALARIFEDAS